MTHRLVLGLALSAVAAAPLAAQRPAPAPVFAAGAAPTLSPRVVWSAPASADRRPRAWPYIVGGALVGTVATAGGIAFVLAHEDTECICSPIAFLPIVVGGAALGAGGGYVVYRIRF